MQGSTSDTIHFLNIEYFFRLLYGSRVSVDGEVGESFFTGFFASFSEWLSHAWGILGMVSFLFSLLAFAVLIYATVRLVQTKRDEDREKYSTLEPEVAEKQKDHARFAHVRALIESAHESDWRQAIIEADIMLDEVLRQAGYEGETVGEKLKMAKFDSLDDAWEAHKVRNEIAHKGSAYKLDNNVAYRTVQKYERVFKEFGEI